MVDDFGIGALARRTGVTPNVLRTWENRFGFPASRRTAAGHRRFTEDDVLLVGEVLAARDQGVPLQLAVESIVERSRQESAASVHAVLIRDFPDLQAQRLGKSTLIAASHAIEDECLARADRAVVLGTFQQGHKFARSLHRWEELGRTAIWSAVLADFTGDPALPADVRARPARCQLLDDSPLRREWTVVILSPTFTAVLAAWQVPTSAGASANYEAVISLRRAPAVAAARVIVAGARAAGALPPPEVSAMLASPTAGLTAMPHADRVLLRVLERMDSRLR